MNGLILGCFILKETKLFNQTAAYSPVLQVVTHLSRMHIVNCVRIKIKVRKMPKESLNESNGLT